MEEIYIHDQLLFDSISGTLNLDQILLLYNVMIIFIKIDIFIKYFNNINCI